MFPRVSAMRATGQPTRKILGLSLAASALLVAAVVAFYALFPGFTATFFAGKNGQYVREIPGPWGLNFVVVFGAVMAIFAVVKMLAFYHLALERKSFIAIYAVGAVAEIVGIFMFHSTLQQILVVMLVVGVALLGLSLLLAVKEKPGQGYSLEPELPIT
jgi:hypothetical protein